jgi:L-fuconolactonase
MIDFPIIDTHVHLLDQKRFKYSWAAGAPKLARDWSPENLTAAAAPYRIESYVFVEVDVDMPQHLDEADWIQETAARDPRLKGCVASLPLEQGPRLEPDIARIADIPVARGIRRLIQNKPDPEFMLRPEFLAALKLLPKYNLSFDICIYHHQLANTLEMVRRCPEVIFILDHIAKPGIKDGQLDPWRQHMKEMAALPNVTCKLSGVITEADHGHWTREQLRPYIDHTLSCFGFDRLMFGGDWPVVELAGTYAGWLEIADWATEGASGEERRKLFRDNAMRVYRL